MRAIGLPDDALLAGGGAAATLPSLPGLSAAAQEDFAALYTAEFGRLAGYLTSLTGNAEVGRDAA